LSATPKDVQERRATATKPAIPGRTANILVEITGREIEQEGMIKMPLNILPMASDDWTATLRASLAKLDELTAAAKANQGDGGLYIRPILLVQAERTGAEQRDSGFIHADDVKAWLVAAGLDETEIALKTSEVNDLDKPENRDLLSPQCRVRVIITKAALAEGWDCPFAYVLCSLAANGNESAMTQLVGRILRQPHALRTGVPALDESYVFTHRAETRAVVSAIKTGLENDGLSDLVQDVILKDPAGKTASKRRIERRDTFRTTDIALPQVLWIEGGQAPRPLDAESDLFPAIDWQGLDLSEFVQELPAQSHAAESQLVRISTGAETGFVTEAAAPVAFGQDFDGAHAVRMIADIVPNSFVARELVETVMIGLAARGLDSAAIGGLSAYIIDEMRKLLSRYRDEQAAAIFSDGLDCGQIEFRVRGDHGDWQAPDHIWTSAEENAAQLPSKTGGALERSLFLPVYAQDLNAEEQNVAIYLDAETVIRWWHRNGSDRQSYGVRGWRRGNVYPDFVFAALRNENQDRIVAVETKGEQLSGNLDTIYKAALLDRLSAAYRSQGRAQGGDLTKHRTAVDFQAAVVLFGDTNAKLPVLIHGAEGAEK